MQVSESSSRSLKSLPWVEFLTSAQVPVVRVTVRLGPDSTAGTSMEALKNELEQYLHAQQSRASVMNADTCALCQTGHTAGLESSFGVCNACPQDLVVGCEYK